MPKVPEAYLAARRDEILDAAWRCFARQGYHGATMQDICKEAGLSAGALYRYFDSKEQVLAAINARNLEQARALVEEARARAHVPIDSLATIGLTMLHALEEPGFETTSRLTIELWPEVLRNPPLRADMRRELAFWHDSVSEILGAALPRNATLSPDVMAALFICAYEGLRHYALIDPERFRPEILLRLGEALAGDGRSVTAAAAHPADGGTARPGSRATGARPRATAGGRQTTRKRRKPAAAP
jgi:AcrR family transcriptional regulator